MDNIYDLVNNLKELAVKATRATEPMSTVFAEVVTPSPLKLDMGSFKVSESDELLVLTKTIRNLISNDKLKKGDSVLCLQEEGGEDWIVIDVVEVS